MKNMGTKKRISHLEFLKISHDSEFSGAPILSVRTRIWLVLSRGILASLGYMGFQIAKLATGLVDNSILFGADALVYAGMAFIILRERFSLKEKLGIGIATAGVIVVFAFDVISSNNNQAVWGGLFGIASSVSLAMILILTSTIVQHDHPVRVALYHACCGLLFSLLSCLIFFDLSQFQSLISMNYIQPILIGILYSIALILFLFSFYYVDPVIVAISSYSLDLYSVAFDYFIKGEIVSTPNVFSLILVYIGTGILVRAEYIKYKQDRSDTNQPK